MKQEGLRHNAGKLKWSLVPMKALEPMVKVLMFGASKYAPWNWTKGLAYSEISESLQRHLNAFMSGEEDDEESKLSHLGHLLCNALFLSYMHIYRRDMDDRYEHKVYVEEEEKVEEVVKFEIGKTTDLNGVLISEVKTENGLQYYINGKLVNINKVKYLFSL